MKAAAITKIRVGTGTASRVMTLSTSCFSFLSLVCSKPQQNVGVVKHAKVPHTHLPRPASTYIMLTESDVKGDSHGILP